MPETKYFVFHMLHQQRIHKKSVISATLEAKILLGHSVEYVFRSHYSAMPRPTDVAADKKSLRFGVFVIGV